MDGDDDNDDNDGISFVTDQHVWFDLESARSPLKQHFAGRDVAPL